MTDRTLAKISNSSIATTLELPDFQWYIILICLIDISHNEYDETFDKLVKESLEQIKTDLLKRGIITPLIYDCLTDGSLTRNNHFNQLMYIDSLEYESSPVLLREGQLYAIELCLRYVSGDTLQLPYVRHGASHVSQWMRQGLGELFVDLYDSIFQTDEEVSDK